MGLQVRVRHPLGDRLVELSPTDRQKPVVVGRMASAEVQVPSVAVAPKHSLLFVHQGRWAVQDAAGATGPGTFVNGRRIPGATFLKVGDRISLGPDADTATLEIDPDGASEGRSGYALADPTAAPPSAPPVAQVPQPARHAAGYAQPAVAPAAYPPPAHPYLPAAPVAVPVAQPWSGDQETPADGDTIAWQGGTSAAASYPPTYAGSRGARRNQGGSGTLIATVVICGLLLGGIVYFYDTYKKPAAAVAPAAKGSQPTTAVVAPKPAPAVADPAEVKSDNIFGVPVRDLSVPATPGGETSAAKVSANAVEVGGTLGVGRKAQSTFRDAASFAGNAAAPSAPSELSPSDQAAAVLATTGVGSPGTELEFAL